MLYMPFLYFPEDKSEYIPATIMLIIFMIGAVVATYFIFKKSRKDEQKFEEEYREQIQKAEEEDSLNSDNK